MNTFIFRAKPDGKTDISDRALLEGLIYYGLADIPGLLDPSHTLETVRQAVANVHPEYIPLREAKMFWLFSRAMQVGDLILMPIRVPGARYVSYCLGEVIGDAFADLAFAGTHTVYRRPVRWLNDKCPIDRDALPARLIAMINQPYNVRRTCLDVSEFTVVVSEMRQIGVLS